MLGTRSFKCKTIIPFRCNGKEYDINDEFTVRFQNPLEKGYLNMGFVEPFNEEDYIYEVVNNTGLGDILKVGDILSYTEIKENIPDPDMFVRLGNLDKILKSDTTTNDSKAGILPYGTKPCNGHKALNIKYQEFISILIKLDIPYKAINKPLTDEQIDIINRKISR